MFCCNFQKPNLLPTFVLYPLLNPVNKSKILLNIFSALFSFVLASPIANAKLISKLFFAPKYLLLPLFKEYDSL